MCLKNRGGIMTIKKFLLLLIIVPLVFSIQSCGKGAGGGNDSIAPGHPVYIKLKPSRYAAQTNGCIEFYAEVHDANGLLLANIPVQFTNLTEPFGQLLNRCGGTEINPPVRIYTDGLGRARVTLYSTTPGFATILASTDIGEQPRDRKTVLYSFCSTYDCLVLAPTVTLDVDSEPPDGILNEAEDFIIFNPIPPNLVDDRANLWATVRDEYGVLIPYNAHLVWGSDHMEATFTRTENWTNEDGVATAQVEFTPSSLRGTETHVNVWAYSDNVSQFVYPMGIVTFFLQPVSIASITVTADPPIVEPEGESEIIALVMLNTGDPAFDGVPVTFTSCLCEDPPDCLICNDPCGYVDPFAMTEGGNGQAIANFTAPQIAGTCMITATANGVSDSVNVLVTTDLTIRPASQTLTDPAVGDTVDYDIVGGVPPYVVYVSEPTLVSAVIVDRVLTVTVDAIPPADTTITITVYDAVNDEATATLIIEVFSATPSSASICESTTLCSAGQNTQTFTISGGTAPYTVTSSDNTVIADPGLLAGNTFTVDAIDYSITADTSILLTIVDSSAVPLTNTATVNVINEFLVVSTVPANGAVGVAADTPVVITWDDIVDCTTVTPANVTIAPPPAGWAPTCVPGGTTATFTPTGQVGATSYTVTITTNVTDTSGLGIPADYVFSYTTL